MSVFDITTLYGAIHSCLQTIFKFICPAIIVEDVKLRIIGSNRNEFSVIVITYVKRPVI